SIETASYYNTDCFPRREELAEYYAGKTGLPLDHINYYIVLAQFKLGVLLERKLAESLIGKISQETGQYFGEFTLVLIGTAEALGRGSKFEGRGMARPPAELFDLTGKVALVTGGSRGLGREMVLGFAAAGADVIIASRKLDACAAVAREVEALGRRAL